MMVARVLAFAAPLGLLAAGSGCSEAPTAGPAPAQAAQGSAQDYAASVTAILNAGVMAETKVEGGETVKLLFDPLYDDHFGSLAQLTPDLIEAITSGAAPYDNVDIVFVSHAHGDHFSASQLTAMLRNQPDLQLVLPAQAMDDLRGFEAWEPSYEERLRTIDLDNGEAADRFTLSGATIEAFRSPHNGWPDRHANVHNISFRVSVPSPEGGVARVMHLGDADPSPEHFAPLAQLLSAKRTGIAMVPFWFYRRDDLPELLDETLNSQSAVAVHVPVDVPGFLAEQDRPYFTKVGEVVEVPLQQ